MDQIITIELLGEIFKFRVDEPGDEAEKVAAHLVQEVGKVESQLPSYTAKTNKLAIIALAALNISRQHLELVRKYSDMMNKIKGRTTKIRNLIETRPSQT